MPAYSVQAYSVLWRDATTRIATGSIQEHDPQRTPNTQCTSQPMYSLLWCDMTARVQQLAACKCTAYSQSAAADSIQQHDHLHTPAYSIHARVQRTANATTRVQQSAAYNDVIASVERHDEMRLPKSSNWQHITIWPVLHASVQRTY